MSIRCLTSLRLIGDDFDLSSLLIDIGLKPDCIWKKGDSLILGKKSVIYSDSGISFDIKLQPCLDLSEQISLLLDRLKPYAGRFIEAANKHHLQTSLSCVVYSEDNIFPSVFIKKELLKDILRFNADIDIDIY